MSDYREWFKKQPESFQRLIVKDPNKVKKNFVDENYTPITLEELKELDEKYNFNDED